MLPRSTRWIKTYSDLHGPTLEFAEDGEDLLGGASGDLGADSLGESSTQPLTQTPCGATGVTDRECCEFRPASECLARDLGRVGIVS